MVLNSVFLVSIVTLVTYSTEAYTVNSSIEDRLATLEKYVENLNGENGELRELVADLKQDLRTMELRTKELSKELESLKDTSNDKRVADGSFHKRMYQYHQLLVL